MYDVEVDARWNMSFLSHLIQPLNSSNRSFTVNTHVCGIIASFGQAENVAAVGGHQREKVVGIILLNDVPIVYLTRIFQRNGDVADFVPGLWRFGNQFRVVDERYVLDSVRHAVQLSVVATPFQAHFHKLVFQAGQVDRSQQAVDDQLAEPVVGADEYIRAFTGRRHDLHTVTNVAETNLGYFEADAILGEEVIAQVNHQLGAGLISPHHQPLVTRSALCQNFFKRLFSFLFRSRLLGFLFYRSLGRLFLNWC